MSKKLLIVESPTKARTISRMLGADYKIMASMGHVRDLPERSFGVDVQNNFAPMYTDNSRSKKVVADLRSAVKKATEVYLAPDPDREGEAIAWHLSEVLKNDFKGDFKRVTFHEITRQAIERALENSSVINMDLVDAQQARRVLDRIVGYQVSPLLWSRIARGISAGRVQSVALRLVVERERAIQAFEPQEYWNIQADFKGANGAEFSAKLFKINGKDCEIPNADTARKVLADLNDKNPFAVSAITVNNRSRAAQPPFTTSTLQQFANSQLHFSASATMRYAQQLYEGVDLGKNGETVGLITYMRTDSVNIAKEAQMAAAEFIAGNYGKEYCPAKFNYFKSKGLAQEAHEAIRPTDVNRTPESLAGVLDSAQLKLYSLIWKRFVASQMAPAKLKQLAVDVCKTAGSKQEYQFRANAQITVFPGFLAVFPDNKKEEAAEHMNRLASLKEQEPCQAENILDEQKFTEPPPRYTEASLIKELEENGIGRPSTYATILKTIQARNYVVREKNSLLPSELGFQVNDFLIAALPKLFQVDFTRGMEQKLDEVEDGKIKWTNMLHTFYDQFTPWLSEAKAAGAVDADKSVVLLDLLKNVKWNAPVKAGRKVYDDKKFYDSIAKKYTDSNRLSLKQFVSLLELAAKYEDELPDLSATAEKIGATDELTAAREKAAAVREKAQNAGKTTGENLYADIFAAFGKVKWDEPVSRRGRSFDEKKFFGSLESQAESGKVLSDKQLDVLRKMAVKYREQLSSYELVAEKLKIQEAANVPADAAANQQEVADLLAKLKGVTTWTEPVKQGRRVYDDQAFFKSLEEQYTGGKTLSDRQIAALKKLAGKYDLA